MDTIICLTFTVFPFPIKLNNPQKINKVLIAKFGMGTYHDPVSTECSNGFATLTKAAKRKTIKAVILVGVKNSKNLLSHA